MNRCTICDLPIVLVPSAAERAAKSGGTAAFYTSLFTEHARCTLHKREQDTLALMRSTRAAGRGAETLR